MNRTDPNYRLAVNIGWTRTNRDQEICPACHGVSMTSRFGFADDEEKEPCSHCRGSGLILAEIPKAPEMSLAFIDHMSKAFNEYWANQAKIEEKWENKYDETKSLNSSQL